MRARGQVYAIRNLLDLVRSVRILATVEPLIGLARAIIGPQARPVRGLLFDKNPDARWLVPWHQDLTICLKERRDVAGFGPWSTKAGVVHVQPPLEILENMVTIRVHLDAATAANGALRVLPGTHRLGRLNADQIERCRRDRDQVTCCLPRGGVLLMKPLLLHASSAPELPGHRRVVHIEYASSDLPSGLEWHDAAPGFDSTRGG